MTCVDVVVYTYRSCGLLVRSDRALPGLPSAEGRRGEPTLVLATGTASASIPERFPPGRVVVDAFGPDRRLYCAVEDEDGYLLRFPNLCEVRLSRDLRNASCRSDPAADPGLVGVLLSGTVLAFVLALLGRCVLHASAVEVDGRALAFVGDSGMGKSTLTVAACLAGARLVAEDVLVADTATGADTSAYCLPGNTEVRLRPAAIPLLEDADAWVQTTTADGRRSVQPPRTQLERVALATIVIPRPSRQVQTMTVESVSAASALVRLVAFPRVIGLIDPQVSHRQFDAIGRIVRCVPVLVATVPWGPPFAKELGEQLLRLMGDG